MFWISSCLLCGRAGDRGAGQSNHCEGIRRAGTAERDKSILKTAFVKQITVVSTAASGLTSLVGCRTKSHRLGMGVVQLGEAYERTNA